MNCRHCAATLRTEFLDLGTAPPSNSFLRQHDLNRGETWLPLKLYVCEECFLVQIDEIEHHTDIFSEDYIYFSSFSSSWLAHAAAYVEDVAARLHLGKQSLVIEVASNDGYLLKNFVARDIPCVGIEPTTSTAKAARALGVPTRECFLTSASAAELRAEIGPADLVIGNNVYAHVPDINDFTSGLRTLLAPNGVVTLEFPHLLQLVAQQQFDTVYHEHYSYLSLATARKILQAQGLRVFDVDEIATHGGSLRLWICHHESERATQASVETVLGKERKAGMGGLDWYLGFQTVAERIKHQFLRLLLREKAEGRRVAAYGAAAKGNTLLNFAGVRADLIEFVVDRSPHKQQRFLPGSRIPVLAESALRERRPDTIIILPWNLESEISTQLAYTQEWGARLIPAITVFDTEELKHFL